MRKEGHFMQDNDDAKHKSLEQELEQTRGERDRYKAQLHSEKIGNAFARSKFVQDRVAVPDDMFQSLFGPRFSVEEDGRLVAKIDGVTILSRNRLGEPAEFEEAIELLVNDHPEKARILAAPSSPVSEMRSTNGAGQAKTMTRRAFDALSQRERHARMRDGFRLID